MKKSIAYFFLFISTACPLLSDSSFSKYDSILSWFLDSDSFTTIYINSGGPGSNFRTEGEEGIAAIHSDSCNYNIDLESIRSFNCRPAVLLRPFVTTWKTDNPGVSGNSSITIPTEGTGYSYDVDWDNDGIYDELGITGDITHDFGIPGTYTIALCGNFPRINFFGSGVNSTDAEKIISIDQWGDIVWDSMQKAFINCTNLAGQASDTPNLSNVTDLNLMFSGCTNFNQDIGNWDVSNIEDMGSMFSGCTQFNQDLSNWNVGKVANMITLFNRCILFNQDLSNWDVSSVSSMAFMFSDCVNFNQELINWDVSSVNNMSNMFSRCSNFNQDLGNWDVGNVTDMSSMFGNSAFNQNLSDWNVSSVVDMGAMFQGCTNFNQDISNWNVENVTDMSGTFVGCTNFNQDISNWNVENVMDMSGMFSGCSNFNQDLSNWNVGNVISIYTMFSNCTSFNQDLGSWNVDKVTKMDRMFRGCTNFNQDLSSWNLMAISNDPLHPLDGIDATLDNCGMSVKNYEATLLGWANNPNTPRNLDLGAQNLGYCNDAGRNLLINNLGWTISGDLQLFEGDSCDDGDDSNGLDDVIQSDCSCAPNCNHPDYNALIELYIATTGINWNNTRNNIQVWDQSCDPCDGSWYGVACENGRVTCIDLDNHLDNPADCRGANTALGNNLQGEIPDLDLSELRFLALSGNALDTVPNFSMMPKLDTLFIYSSGLSGDLPSFENCPELSWVNFSFNLTLEGQIPNFERQSNLERLILDNNQFSGTLPDISFNPDLIHIQLTNNQIQDTLPEGFAARNWQFLYLESNMFYGCYPESYLDKLCGQTISFLGNTELPWQGDFDQYCVAKDQFGAPCDRDLDGLDTDEHILCNCFCGSITTPIYHPDYNGLMDLYNSTGGANWYNTQGDFQVWDQSCDPCDGSWYGIDCDNGRVVCIDLDEFMAAPVDCLSGGNATGNNLIGEIPNLDLDQLKVLILSGNSFDTIPNFTDLPNLSSLFITNSDLSGEFPSLQNCPLLRIVSFSNNDLDGQISDFSMLTNLEIISLSINRFSGALPSISFNPILRNLSLSNNEFRDTLPDEFAARSWDFLSVAGNNLYGCFPSIYINTLCNQNVLFDTNLELPWEGDFSQFCSLIPQDGANCNDGDPNTQNEVIQGSDCICKELELIPCNEQHQDYPALLDLYLSTNGPSDWIINSGWEAGRLEASCNPCDYNGAPWYGVFCENNRVTRIDLDGVVDFSSTDGSQGNGLTGGMSNSIKGLTELKLLFLNKNSISGFIPDSIWMLDKLEFLILNHNNFSGSLSSDVSNLRNLRGLSLGVNQLTGEIPTVLGTLTNLENLNLSRNNLEGTLPVSLASLSELTILDFSENNLSGAIPDIFSNYNRLLKCLFNDNNLEGCYPNSVNEICDRLSQSNSQAENGYNFRSNALLPWEGELSNYCSGAMEEGAPCSGDKIILADCSCGMDNTAVLSCRERDSMLLMKFYSGLSNNEFLQDKWISGAPLESWYGIQLSSEGCVLFVDLDGIDDGGISNSSLLSEIEINGSLNPLFRLDKLEKLSFANCNLTKINADSLAQLSELEELGLANCNLVGDINFNWVAHRNLRTLNLASNKFSGQINNDFYSLENLISLNLSYNNISGELNEAISDLSILRQLELRGNNVTGSIPQSLTQLDLLLVVDLGDNNFVGEIPSGLDNLDLLRKILMDNNNLESCFQDDMEFICDFSNPNILPQEEEGYNFLGNDLMPWKGDFSKFCNIEEMFQEGADCFDETNNAPLFIIEDCECVPLEIDLDEEKYWVFTPNGDGIGDCFIIPAIAEDPVKNDNIRLTVFNRWGQVLYSERPYKNDWKGINQNNGKDLADGTYFFITEGLSRAFEGYVTILRN